MKGTGTMSRFQNVHGISRFGDAGRTCGMGVERQRSDGGVASASAGMIKAVSMLLAARTFDNLGGG